jgi:CBS domain-containing protein
MSVPVSTILARKGAAVFTIRPDTTLAEAARVMVEHNVGALVVSADGRTLEGMISERDVVRSIAAHGADELRRPVVEVMSGEVTVCRPGNTVDQVMATMTERRIRHVPVVEDGIIAGIVSIGDIVKFRLDELEVQTAALEQYVTGSRT